MTSHFMKAAISVSLKTSMCYLHCTRNLGGFTEDIGVSAEAPYRIEPEPGVLCQSQCWQNWDQSKQLKMFGLNELNNTKDWGVNASEFITASYHHWQWSRYGPDLLFPTVEQLLGKPYDSTSGVALPVCFSSQPVQDYHLWFNIDKALPCICGDELGNETMHFFQEANFASWVSFESGKGLADACQTSFEIDKTLPVQVFLTYCQFGWHFPVHDDEHNKNATNGGHHKFGLGRDDMCDDAKKEALEIVERGGTITDVNCHLCWISETGKTIKENQRHYVHSKATDPHNHYNFNEACNRHVSKDNVCKLIT